MGAAQIEIQAKKFFHGFLEKSFKIQNCQKPNKNQFLIENFEFCPLKKNSKGGQNSQFHRLQTIKIGLYIWFSQGFFPFLLKTFFCRMSYKKKLA